MKKFVVGFKLLLVMFLISGCGNSLMDNGFQTDKNYQKDLIYGSLNDPKPNGPSSENNELEPQEKPPELAWPVDQAVISQKFRREEKHNHDGLDIIRSYNAPIYAAHDGSVSYVSTGKNGGYGSMVIIEFDDKWTTLYAHLNKISVKKGQTVVKGQPIATMGNTGHVTGTHLHFELRKNKQAIDPLPYLP